RALRKGVRRAGVDTSAVRRTPGVARSGDCRAEWRQSDPGGVSGRLSAAPNSPIPSEADMSHPQNGAPRLVRYGRGAIVGAVGFALVLVGTGPAGAEPGADPHIANGSAVADGTYPWAV